MPRRPAECWRNGLHNPNGIAPGWRCASVGACENPGVAVQKTTAAIDANRVAAPFNVLII
jgi:hypothetical protein